MTIILSANVHVGSAAAKALLKEGQPITVVLHSDEQEANWIHYGAQVVTLDVNDTNALHQVFNKGVKLFFYIRQYVLLLIR